MSLTLVFHALTAHRVGPLTSFRLDGEALRKLDGEVIAKHERDVWRIGGEHYPRLECKGSVLLWFERGSKPDVSRKFGPHNDLSMFDGVAYIGNHVFASLNKEAGNWYSHENGHYWRVMAVEFAG
jgi:hypothetical protein